MFVHDHCVILFKAQTRCDLKRFFSWWRQFCQMVCCVCICICLSEVIDNVLASVQLSENDRPFFENGKFNIQQHLLFLFPFKGRPYPKCYSL